MKPTAGASVQAPAPPLRVENGNVAVLRLFDVANAIDLTRAEREATGGAPVRMQLTHVKPKAIAYGVAPLAISLGRIDVDTSPAPITADVTSRVFDFGAVSLIFRFRADGLEWDEFADLVDRANSAMEENGLWNTMLRRVLQLIQPALEEPTPIEIQEDYLIATVTRFDRPMTAERILAEVDVPRVLSGERETLSRAARDELLRNTFGYYTDDLVVVTWDRAFLVEPRGESDVVDVLEVANAQLLELRYYDALLDAELPRMYERVEIAQRTFRALSRRAYANLAREIYKRVAEVTEIAEKIDNALIVTEDVYLARIYGAAVELFRVRAWNAAVDRKLSIMRDTYAALYDEAATVRAEYLEAAIVLLIVFEIVIAFLR
jgi:hypothetical protein